LKFHPWAYLLFVGLCLLGWGIYMISSWSFILFSEHWPVSLTMVIGSFVAGATSEGGGAIAFPVLTLLLEKDPATARNFSLAIQSIGMTAASIFIVGLKIKVEKRAIVFVSISGILGMVIVTLLLPDLLSPARVKLFFVSLWLSFGLALYIVNTSKNRIVNEQIPDFKRRDLIYLLIFGFIGGGITALIGNGIDILTFFLLTMYYKVSEKIATPTSVLLMTINTITGFLLHVFVVGDFRMGDEAFNMWLVCIPIVIFGAPLGAYVVNLLSRTAIAYFLYLIILTQFVGAYYVFYMKGALTPENIVFSIVVIFGGVLLVDLMVNRVSFRNPRDVGQNRE